MVKTEEKIHNNICMYLDLKYPNAMYITDLSGIKLTIGQSVKAKKQRHKKYKVLDITILEQNIKYHGLIIEVKKSVDEVFTKDGKMRNSKHIKEQQRSIEHLNSRGYLATFATGFDNAVKIIEEYFKIPF